jgi:hypothetical protein
VKDFSSLKREADNVCQSILTCPPNRTHGSLVSGLKRLRNLVIDTCKGIDLGSTAELDYFKEVVHEAYWTIAEPFNMQQVFEIPFRVYYDMSETIDECTQLTKFKFDKGFEYANLSIAEVGLRNLDQGFAHMELAKAEDDRIGHKKGVAATHLQYIFDKAYMWINSLSAKSTNSTKTSTICETKLEWTEKCRLAKSMWKFQIRIKDNRSSLNNEDLERNLVNICKIVENYLRRKNPIPGLDPRRQTLTPLVNHAFEGYGWLEDWRAFRDDKKLDYSDPEIDDMKLVSLFSDESRIHEANIFLAVCMIRNFGAHIYNDQSALFSREKYDTAFSMCVEALMYTLSHV